MKDIVHSWGGDAGVQHHWVLVYWRFSCVKKRGSTWYHMWTNVRADLPTWGLRLSNVQNNMRCPFSTFAIMNMQCWVFLPECAKCKEDLAQASWFTTLNSNTNLKLIVFACLSSTSERQVLISTASHTGGCRCCGADCNDAPIWVISCTVPFFLCLTKLRSHFTMVGKMLNFRSVQCDTLGHVFHEGHLGKGIYFSCNRRTINPNLLPSCSKCPHEQMSPAQCFHLALHCFRVAAPPELLHPGIT